MFHSRGVLLVAAVLYFLPLHATSQTVTIRVGQTITDRLTPADRTLSDGSYFHQHVYAGSMGDEIVITLTSPEFDAFLMWGLLADGQFESATSDDDGGGGTNSQIRTTVGAGTFAIRVNSFGAAEAGAYTLTVERAGGVALSGDAAAWMIGPGETVTGRLGPDDSLFDGDQYYEWFDYEGAASEEVVITLRSPDFDTYLTLMEWVADSLEVVASDDDGGGGTDSQLRTVIGPGIYTVDVSSYGTEEIGAYSLTVERAGGVVAGGGGGQVAPGELPSIFAGQPVNARLESSDPTLDDGSHFKIYLYRGRPGEQIVVTMRSSDFDAFLTGGNWDGSQLASSETDDDGGGGTDARLAATIGGNGTYAITANSYGAGATGAFTLTVQPSLPPSQTIGASGRTIAPGQTVTGRLAAGDPQLTDQSYYHAYNFNGRAGDRVLVTLTSPDFDSYLVWGRRLGGEFERLDFDDDGGGGTNSQLEVSLAESRTYEIWVNSYGAAETGAYTLSVEGSGGTSGLPLVALGQTLTDRLTSSDPTLNDNSHFKVFLYRGTPGEQLLVTMRSNDFDAYLSGGRVVSERFEPEVSDDDSGGGRDAQILATVGTGGTYAIRANSWSEAETGQFTLTVEPIGGARPNTPTIPAGQPAVAPGDRVNGALRASDPMLGDSSFYNQYTYRGNPGDRLRITLISTEFDAYLRWGLVEDGRVQAEAYDDDSGGGTNAQLEVTVGGTGTYAVQANSFSAGQTGAYTLTVERLATGMVVVAPESPAGFSGKWMHAYVDSMDPAFRSLAQRVKQWRPLEDMTDDLNRTYPLPRNVHVAMDECGVINAYYSPRDAEIVFCYELIEYLADQFAPSDTWTVDEQEAVLGAIHFILLHEVGHALVDQLDIPITGREEDAVDQLATVTLVALGEKGAVAALRGVEALQPDGNNFDDSDFADEHSLGPVRLYNVACWVYGSNPQRYSNLVTGGFLPQERAARCTSEWEQMQKSWERLLAPYTQQ